LGAEDGNTCEGCPGYIGNVTVKRLQAKAERVVVLDDLAPGYRETLDPGIPFHRGRARDRAFLARILAEHEIEPCIQFTALAFAGESVVELRQYFEDVALRWVPKESDSAAIIRPRWEWMLRPSGFGANM
jgi:UDP-glucose 4-epimerase